jgi:N6-adenosine-specific RNA methylase IME4
MNKRYQIIYADPPWEVKRGPDWNSNGPSKNLPYPTMKLEDIKSLKVKDIVDKNAHLYLWTINKYIEQTYDVARNWGFKPSCLLTWCKPRHGIGLGGAFIQTTEHLLFCRRGTLSVQKRIDTTWFEHKRLKHSEKPNYFRDLIVEVSGNLARIELFARQKIDGWDIWGNELSNSVELK